MNFAGQYVTLNKQTELWIDEAQDLQNSYLDAMAKLMLDTNCDIHIVGDKLQTLEFEDNFLTSIIKENGLIENINLIVNYLLNLTEFYILWLLTLFIISDIIFIVFYGCAVNF